MSGEPLVCSGCGLAAPADERFCDACGMPLVIASTSGVSEATELQERARKTKKQYSEGPLVRVAYASHQAEAELIQGLLLEHGVPSMYKRSGGFDVPDMLFSGPRDVFVPASGVDVAREVLAEVEASHTVAVADARAAGEPGRPRASRSTRTMAVGLAIALGLFSIVPATVLLSRAFG